jgi:hypothetical protein
VVRVASVIHSSQSYGTSGRFYAVQWNIGPVIFSSQHLLNPGVRGSGRSAGGSGLFEQKLDFHDREDFYQKKEG